MRIYILRHGELENPNNVVYGRLPGFPLSQKGRSDIEQISKKFVTSGIKKIYSSPLQRTAETAEILAGTIGIKKEDIIIDNRLIESDTKDWEGRSRAEFIEKYQAIISRNEVEPVQDAGKRAYEVLQEIADKGESAIVVSHGDPIMGALGLIIGNWSIMGYFINKGEFAKVDIDGSNWQVGLYNEI